MKKLSKNILNKVVNSIVSAMKPVSLYLYGSHVYGEPHEDSDIDILVVVAETSIPVYRRAVIFYKALRGLKIPVDIKVDTKNEFEERKNYISSIERTIAEKGKLLYGTAL